MSRVFLSHSSRDTRQAVAVKAWLVEHEPGLAEEIFLDLDPHSGIRPGERWKQRLQQANARCEAVICLLSKHWEASHECKTESARGCRAGRQHARVGLAARQRREQGHVPRIGAFISAIIYFMVFMAVVYFVIVLPYKYISTRRGVTVFGEPGPTTTWPACLSDDLPAAASKCKYCGPDLAASWADAR